MLAVAELAGLRSGTGWFSVGDIGALREALRLPPPPDASAVLSHLKRQEYVVRRPATPSWSVTPKGHTRVVSVLGQIDPLAVEGEMSSHPGAEFAHGRQMVLPPQLALPKWLPPITRLLERHAFEGNVFCMTRYSEEPTDVVNRAAVIARGVLAKHGLVLHLANDRTVDPELFGNVAAYMWACRYGVAFLEDRVGRGLNENVVIEIGAMLFAGRSSALLKDVSLKRDLPTDLVGQIYKKVDLGSDDGVSRELHRWAARDLGLGACGECPAQE